jgi:hypothetical protein
MTAKPQTSGPPRQGNRRWIIRGFVAVIVAVIVGSAYYAISFQGRTGIPAWAQFTLKAAVNERLIDPTSAQIRDIEYSKGKATYDMRRGTTDYSNSSVCFQVNAKNRLGGYAGWKYGSAEYKPGEGWNVGPLSEWKFNVCENE